MLDNYKHLPLLISMVLAQEAQDTQEPPAERDHPENPSDYGFETYYPHIYLPPSSPVKGSEVLKTLVFIMVICCTMVCVAMFFLNYHRREYREKIELLPPLGLALAYIVNKEDENNSVKHGFGPDEDVIDQWVIYIWETYDFNDDGNLDKREVKKFIDQSFRKAGVRDAVPYSEYDLDDLFIVMDITSTGMISRAELKQFFKKLAKMEPDEEMRKRLDLVWPRKDDSQGDYSAKVDDEENRGPLESDRKGLVDNEERMD